MYQDYDEDIYFDEKELDKEIEGFAKDDFPSFQGINKIKRKNISGKEVRERFYTIMEMYHSGDAKKKQDAIEEAIKELEGIIFLVMKKSYPTYIHSHFYDLLQEGYLGVAEGMKRYNPDKSLPSTYFYPFIKHEMQDYLTQNVFKTSSHYALNLRKVNKAIFELEQKGVDYSNVDIAIQTGMTIEVIDQLLNVRDYTNEVHLDAFAPNVVDAEVGFRSLPTPEEDYIQFENTDTIYRVLKQELTEEELKVVTLNFGLFGQDPMYEVGIAKELGFTKEKVKRLLNRSLRKLKNSALREYFSEREIEEENNDEFCSYLEDDTFLNIVSNL